MIYCDTSLPVAGFVSETNSLAARRWLEVHSDSVLVVSDCVITEFASALAMKLRRGTIDQAQRREIDQRWQAMLNATFTITPVRSDHFSAVAALVDTGRNGLRAGDALHLASCLDSSNSHTY